MVTGFLVDTNVLSELRKGDRADDGVVDWFVAHETSQLYLSVIVLGELRRGAALLRRRDSRAADSLDEWVDEVIDRHASRILDITARVAVVWGHLGVPDPVPVADGLIAATALAHDLTVVTRNTGDITPTGAKCLNPFAA